MSSEWNKLRQPENEKMDKTMTDKKTRGPSPRGDFEQSKAYALADRAEKTDERQKKTNALRALRLAATKNREDARE